MPVNQKIAIGRVLVLANLARQKGRVRECWNAQGKITANGLQPFLCGGAIACVWIKLGSVRIDCNLEAVVF
jgi:hypothetical protein